MTQTLIHVFALPQMASSHFREVVFSLDWWQRVHAEAKSQAELAWKVYDDAIEAQEPKEVIFELGEVAKIFDNIRAEAWRNWDQAKAIYLQMLN